MLETLRCRFTFKFDVDEIMCSRGTLSGTTVLTLQALSAKRSMPGRRGNLQMSVNVTSEPLHHSMSGS